MSLVNFALILTNTLIMVSGQFLWKYGMQQPHSFQSFVSIVKMLLSPYIFAGLSLYGVATVLWLFILTRVPLSVAYPVQSLAYVFTLFGAAFLFQEPITPAKIAGVLLIIAGVSVIGWK
ncbi:EamA family transporter [Bacillus badius]|uniref:EamA family transporter n=1 Tax=Bacillus badius TaxID=1455 RepID=UPI002E24EC57|nr:EamA family transporter [Bacillus badius]MED0665964.1 EamA family transporter [Bacillus badius]